MKTISAALLSAIESGAVATLIKVTLANGSVYGYTDHDAPLTVGGQLYVPVAGQSVLKMTLTSDAAVSTQDVVAGWTPIISEQAVLEGLYDFAQVEFSLATWVSAGAAIPVYQSLSIVPGSYTSSSTSSVSVPAQAAIGDLLILMVTNGSANASLPSGFTSLSSTGAGAVGWRTMQEGDSAFALPVGSYATLFAIHGSSGEPPSIDVFAPTALITNQQTIVTPDATPTGPNDLALFLWMNSDGALAAPAPSNTNLINYAVSGTGGCGMAISYKSLTSESQVTGDSCGYGGGGSAYPGIGATLLVGSGAPFTPAPVDLGSVPLFGGRIGKITYLDKGFTAQAFSNMWSLSQFIGIEFTANCRHKFGATQDPQGVGGCFYDASGQVYSGQIVGTIINAVEFYVGMNSETPATPNSPNAPSLSAAAVFPSTSGGTQYLAPTEGAPYSYSISAIVDGVESPSSPISSIYTTLSIQGLPTFWQSLFQAVLPGNAVGSTITLNWNAVPNATAYNIYGRFDQTLLATVSGSTLSWTDNGSASGGTINPPYGDFFSQGFLTMTSGQAQGLSREVKFCHSGKLQLWLPLERPVAVGDTFNVQVGCVKTTPACQYKFNNLVNFGGYPGIKPQALYTTPQTGTGTQAKK